MAAIYNDHDVREMLNAEVSKATQNEVAKRIGTSASYLNYFMHRHDANVPTKILEYFELERVFRRKVA